MVNFYLVTNINRREPQYLSDKEYIVIKNKADGSETLIGAEDELTHARLAAKTPAQVQTLLNTWISDENLNPVLDDRGNPLLQTPIRLQDFRDNREYFKEIMKVLRIERGFLRQGDLTEVFRLIRRRLSGDEEREFLERLKKFIKRAQSNG